MDISMIKLATSLTAMIILSTASASAHHVNMPDKSELTRILLRYYKSPKEAQALCDEMRKSPDDPLTQGFLLLHAQYPEEARDAFDRKINAAPACADAYAFRSFADDNLHKPDEMLDSAKKAVELQPNAPGIRLSLAFTYLRSKQLEQSLTEIDKAITLDPSNALPHVLRAECYLLMHRSGDGLKECEIARSLNNCISLVPSETARILIESAWDPLSDAGALKKDKFSVPVPDKSDTSTVKDHDLFLRKLGLAVQEFSEDLKASYSKALPYADKAIKLDPTALNPHCQKAVCLNGLERKHEALAQWNRAARLAPRSPWTHLGKAYLLKSMERWDDCIRECDVVLKLAPSQAAAHKLKADCYYEKGKYEESAKEREAGQQVR